MPKPPHTREISRHLLGIKWRSLTGGGNPPTISANAPYAPSRGGERKESWVELHNLYVHKSAATSREYSEHSPILHASSLHKVRGHYQLLFPASRMPSGTTSGRQTERGARQWTALTAGWRLGEPFFHPWLPEKWEKKSCTGDKLQGLGYIK